MIQKYIFMVQPITSPRRTSRLTRSDVADRVRRDIVTGNYRPGDQVPTREVLLSRIPAGYVTIQRGLDQLREEGFVVSRQGDGTYVAPHPPHLSHYAMVILKPESLRDSGGPYYFQRVMVAEAERFNRENPEKRLRCFFDVHAHSESVAYQELLNLVQHHRLAGLLFPESVDPFLGTTLLRQPKLGRVTAAHPSAGADDVASILIDTTAFLDRSLELLAARGRRRVAVLYGEGTFVKSPSAVEFIAERAAAAGLGTRPHWNIPMKSRLSEGVRLTTRLLFDRPPADRPDGLILLDDHLVEAATTGLHEAGVDAIADLTVIGACNFPERPRSLVPMVRLGFSCRELLHEMVNTIDAQRRGDTPPKIRQLKPILDTEFELATAPQTVAS